MGRDRNIWVIDRGDGADTTAAKRFRWDVDHWVCDQFIYRDVGNPAYPPGIFSHGMDYYNGHLYVCCGELSGPRSYYYKYHAESGATVMSWGDDGSTAGLNWSGQGAHITPRRTFLTTDWLGCKLQEWTLDGAFIRAIHNHLRSDGQSIKCRNQTGIAQELYQTVGLPEDACDYTLEFIAFTNGSEVTAADVMPVAIYTGDPEPRPNRITPQNRQYSHYVLTRVDGAVGMDVKACFVQGDFHVVSGETQDVWRIGVEVQPKTQDRDPRLVSIASMVCFKKP